MKDADHIRWVFNQVLKAIFAYNTGFSLPDPAMVRGVINNNLIQEAKRLCTAYNLCNDFLNN